MEIDLGHVWLIKVDSGLLYTYKLIPAMQS